MDVQEAYKKLMERQHELEEKLTALAALAGEVITARHQFRRVEMEKYEELCQQLEATLDDHAAARARFARALQGES